MTRRIVTTLTIASSAAIAFAGPGSPKDPGWLASLPVLESDGLGGFQRSGGLVNFDFATAESWDEEGDANNEIYSFTIAETTPLTFATWRGTISTVGASWRSEAAILFNTPDPAQSFFLRMGSADDSSGTTTYSDSADIAAQLGFAINGAGMWTIEFFEMFDDAPQQIDAHWTDIDIAFIPAPSTLALIGAGALVVGRRRR